MSEDADEGGGAASRERSGHGHDATLAASGAVQPPARVAARDAVQPAARQGASRITLAIDRARSEGRAAVIGYLTAGDPSLAATPALLTAMAEGGCDIIEVGVPFSDPTADGPVIQRASERALRAGATVRGVLAAVRDARARTNVPFLLFGYANPFLRYGPDALMRDAVAAGVDGFLVVDLPPEECSVLRDPALAAGLDWIPLVAPTTPPARVARIVSVATSFVYFVSVAGVTGAGSVDLRAAGARATDIAREHHVPVAVGFGVSTSDDAHVLAAAGVDAVVVGSAFVRRIEAAADVAAAATAVRDLGRELRAGARRSDGV